MNQQESRHGFDQLSPVRVLRRRVGLVALCLVLVPASAFAYSLAQEEQYSASAKLLFRDPALDQKLFGSSFTAPTSDPAREAATNEALVSLDVVAKRAASAIDGRLSGAEVKDKIDIETAGQSDVISVTATDVSPRFAAKLADTFATEYVAFRREADRSKVSEAQRLVQRQLAELTPAQHAGSEGRSLRERAEQLGILASLQTGNAELVQRAEVPGSASSPKVVLNVALGAVLGLLTGVGLAFVLERFDRRIREPEELEEAFGLPVLGAIPESRFLGTTDGLAQLPPREAESFRMLRARLRYFNVDRDIRSVLVTSAASGDGKSTVAWNLAIAAAGTGPSRVVLVEADLRHPSIAHKYQLRVVPGLAELLSHNATLQDALQQVHLGNAPGADGAPVTLDVVVAGALPPNPSALIESRTMVELLDQLEARYDLVVVDTPPTPIVSDAIPLITRAHGVLIVAWLGKSTRDAARHLRDQLTNLNARMLGVVANHARARRRGYYGYYGYGYADNGAGAPGEQKAGRRQILSLLGRRDS